MTRNLVSFGYSPSERMMSLVLLMSGLAVGLTAAFPIGPAGMLCLERAQTRGVRAGVISASGIALASSVWCLAVVQGLRGLAKYLPLGMGPFRFLLGLILATIATRNLMRQSGPVRKPPTSRELAGQFGATFVLVLANPLTPITVLAVMAVFGLATARIGLIESVGLACSVFAGGMSLWLAIAGLMVWGGRRFPRETSFPARRIISLCALVLGLAYVVSGIWAFR
jgi:putative LysE/RhtB family amino acid efflux pump